MAMTSPRFRHFSTNLSGRDWVVGDIHGCFKELKQALAYLGFNPSIDRLFSVGDLVDKGLNSMDALDWLQLPYFHAIMGNHELLHLMQDFSSATANGMTWAERFVDVRKRHEKIEDVSRYQALVNAFYALPVTIKIDTPLGAVGIIHAEVPMFIKDWQHVEFAVEDINLAKLNKSLFVWGRTRYEPSYGRLDPNERVKNVELIICGHTPVNQPTRRGNHLNIDTGVVFGVTGRYDLHDHPALTLVDLTNQQIILFPIRYGELDTDNMARKEISIINH